MYRAPYVYFVRAARGVRISHTLRPGYELQRMQGRYGEVQWLCGIRAYAVLASILWARFGYCRVRAGWFQPDRRVMLLAEHLTARDPDQLLSVAELRRVFSVVFPESPFVGIADYRLSQTYIERSRCKYGKYSGDSENQGK